jgi:hypothetical protein
MREGLRGEAGEMVKSILAAVLGSADMWSRDVIEVRFSSFMHSERGESGKASPSVPRFDNHTLRAAVLHVDSVVPVIHLFCLPVTITCPVISSSLCPPPVHT